MTIGLTRNPYEKNVSTGLIAAAGALGTDIRVIDLQSVRATVAAHGRSTGI